MSEYDALRKVINHEANQDDDGGFFAKLGGIEPEHDDEGPTAKGLFQHMSDRFPYTGINFVRDGTPIRADLNNGTGPGRNVKKGRSSGPHLQWVKNTTGKIEDIITREEWDKANPPLRPDSSYGANYAQRRYGPNRSPIVKVRREILSNSYGTLTRWNWRCNICGLGRAQSGWWIAMDTADQHARNHH